MAKKESIRYQMARAIYEKFKPTYLGISDNSQEFTNYRNMMYVPSRETHYTIYVRSTMFNNMPIPNRIKLVDETVKFAYDLTVFSIIIFCYDDEEYIFGE